MGEVALGNVDISVRSGPDIHPYFSISLSDPPVGRRKVWFLLRRYANMPLRVFMGGYPVPHPNWEYSVARADLHRLQPLLEIVRGLLQRGLMSEEIIRTFSSHSVQSLRQ
jgi:hypothetical protein